MLKIFNSLSIFFEDSYREVNVREYARLLDISPPTASSLLKKYAKENLLKFKQDRIYLLYRANRENKLFIDLLNAYYRQKLSNLVEFLSQEFNYKSIILFGSISKGEANIDSDIDIFIDSNSKEINLNSFEKILKRKIELHFKPKLNNTELKSNIKNGIILHGEMI